MGLELPLESPSAQACLASSSSRCWSQGNLHACPGARPDAFHTLSSSYPTAQVVKNPPANAGDIRDMGSISGSGRSPRGGNGSPTPTLQYSPLQSSCLENPMDRRSLACYSPWGRKELDMTQHTSQQASLSLLCHVSEYPSFLRMDNIPSLNHGWHHGLSGREFEQSPRHSEGKGSLACCSPRDCKGLDMT